MPATSPAKAILAAIAAALASFLATVQGRTDLGTMKAIDWVIVLVSAAVAGLTVYLVPNQPTGRRRGDLGRTDVITVLVVVFLVLAIIFLATAVF